MDMMPSLINKKFSLLSFKILLCSLFFSCIFLACHKEERFKIGVSQCSGGDWREKMNEEMKRELLFQDAADIEFRCADDSSEKQIADIQYFIDNDFDIILAAPNEADDLTPIIKKAYDSNIPVVIFDRKINGDSYTSYIDLDNKGIGREAADYVYSLLGQKGGEVIEIRGLEGSSPAQERHQGFVETLKKYPMLKLADSFEAKWSEDLAYQNIDSVIKLHPETKVIYAHNDAMAIGASRRLKELGRNDIKILGTDASPVSGMPEVINGIIDATFIYPTEGEKIIRTALAILRGEPYEKIEHIDALAPVDITNVEILIKQFDLLHDQTTKVETLEQQKSVLWSRHKTQTSFLWTAIGFAIILGLMVVLLFITLGRNRNLSKTLERQNKILEEESEKQKNLYTQLDEATNSKLSFFTNVSHDLRTPLTLISGPVESLSKRKYLEPKDRALVSLAEKNIDILKRLINDILDFQKNSAGQSTLYLEELSPVVVLKDWTDMFEETAWKRNIKLTFYSSLNKDFSMAVDRSKIERVFFNIISNAFRYTPNKGSVDVKCGLKDEKFFFSVKDTGAGINPENISKLFDRFFQSDAVHPEGSGIGLAVTKMFVEEHKGSIDVESIPGQGSCFTVYLPISHIEKSADGEPILTQESLLSEEDKIEEPKVVDPVTEDLEYSEFTSDKPLILVIDDNEDIRILLQSILEDKYNVAVASDGKLGIKLAMKLIPDLIICDIMMPGIDGLQTCTELKHELSTSHIPILMLTACKLDEQRIQSYDCGADAFISKPFSVELLKARIRNLIDSRKKIREIYGSGATLNIPEETKIPTSGNDPLGMENEFYSRFITIVKQQYADTSLNTETIASKLGLGGAQLTRKIKALTNYTPVEILRTFRLEKARKMLRTTEKTITEITHATGFNSAAYLTKCFRESFGVTPTEYREKLES